MNWTVLERRKDYWSNHGQREGKADINEVRLYKLDLIERQDLTPDEALDLAFCQSHRTSKYKVTDSE